jgi:Recombinase.
MKDPENPKRWIVDEEAAAVVDRIFTMTLAGMGIEQIAATLQQEEIMTPTLAVKPAQRPTTFG